MSIALNSPFPSRIAFIIRLAIGAIFGLILGFLIEDSEAKKKLLDPKWATIIFNVFFFGAFVIWASVAVMRVKHWLIWILSSTALIFLISLYSVFTYPSFGLILGSVVGFFLAPLLFILSELVIAADLDRKIFAPYPTYFEQAWKRGLQLILSLIFALVFWLILLLGGELLSAIGFDWLKKLLEIKYFTFPLIGLALACAIHLSDVQPHLLKNVRALVLGVFSWLLPVITLIGVIFLVSLCFSGLKPLWDTKHATSSLLTAAIIIVLLINATYQQGVAEREVSVFLTYTVKLASLILLIFSLIAAYSLSLRIGQYGLSTERIIGIIGIIISLGYGLCYTVAALKKGAWMAFIEPTNIGLAILKCVIFILINTPLADPVRLSVIDQVSRLKSEKTTVETFDWHYLRFEAGSYGKEALNELAKEPKFKEDAQKVLSLKDKDRYTYEGKPLTTATSKPDPKKFVPVAGETKKLPDSFLNQEFSDDFDLIDCLSGKSNNSLCHYALIDITKDAQDDILVMIDDAIYIYRFKFENNEWKALPNPYDHPTTPDQAKAFKEGKISTRTISVKQIVIDGQGLATNIKPDPEKAEQAPKK